MDKMSKILEEVSQLAMQTMVEMASSFEDITKILAGSIAYIKLNQTRLDSNDINDQLDSIYIDFKSFM
jgi:hypothetical protein